MVRAGGAAAGRATGRRSGGGAAAEERLERLEDAVDRLRETAEAGTVVVEGIRDKAALEWLGIGGHHVTIHHGQPLERVIEELCGCPTPVVLLMDWDRTGGQLQERLVRGLRARVQIDEQGRRRLASACQTRALEEVPSELEALRRAAVAARSPR